MPVVDKSQAVERASRAFCPDDNAVVYVDCEVREPGHLVVGETGYDLAQPALLVFRDEMPGANWMHPCSYALVALETGEVLLTAAADRPPYFGRLPGTWTVAADPSGRADMVAPADGP